MGKINIREHEKPLSFKVLWIKEQYEKLRDCDDLKDISDEELRNYLLEKYDKRRVVTGRFYNNVTKENANMTQETFINNYLNKPYVLSGYGCFFQNQDNVINISSAALDNLRKDEKD